LYVLPVIAAILKLIPAPTPFLLALVLLVPVPLCFNAVHRLWDHWIWEEAVVAIAEMLEVNSTLQYLGWVRKSSWLCVTTVWKRVQPETDDD